MTSHDILRVVNTGSSIRSIFLGLSYSVAALLLYAYASYQLDLQMHPLSVRCQELTCKLDALKAESHRLHEMVSHSADPAADEHALITELGLIPKGSRKLFFTTTASNTP